MDEWHAWGRIWDSGMSMTVILGPTSLPHDHPDVLSAIKKSGKVHYLKSWDHEPSDEEKACLDDLIPYIIDEELELSDADG